MLFTEPTFLFVFLPVLLGLYFLPWHGHRNWLLVIASVIFYARGAGSFTSLIVASIVFNYLAALWIDRLRGTRAARLVLGLAVASNLVVLGIFKYAGFLTTNLNAALTAFGSSAVPVPEILLPIGISFFTFHAISYVVDVYRRDAAAQKSPVEAALYLLLFPQLIAGPIIRYREIAAQLGTRVHTVPDFAYGIRRFIVGLSKKMLIANMVAAPADRIFMMPPAELTAAHAWLAVACYTLQIYFDFSGYSDMAVGLGRMFGFRFPENFRYPYVAASMQDFWRRWHMTLSAWFRDYLYVPLGGNRVAPRRTYVNLLTVFFLCGLWHGASWTFVVWGLIHGLFLVIERLGLARRLATWPRAIGHAYVLAVTMVAWVFFRASTLSGAVGMLRALVGLSPAAPTAYAPSWYVTPELVLAMCAGAVAATPLAREIASMKWGPMRPLRPALVNVALVALFIASVMLVAARTYDPFIYFRF